jgi:hypothetical protein
VSEQKSLLSEQEIETIKKMQAQLLRLSSDIILLDSDQSLNISVNLIYLKLIGDEFFRNQNNPDYWNPSQDTPSYVVACWIADCNQEIGYATAELTQAA